MDVGHIISILLEREAMTGTQLSEISGVAQNMISDYKRNATNPRFASFVKIVNAIGYEVLMKDVRGKIVRCYDFGTIVEYILAYEQLKYSELSIIANVNENYLRRYVRGISQPTMCVADRIVTSVGYQFKLRKKKEQKNDQN